MKSAGLSSAMLFALVGLSSAHPQGTRGVEEATRPGRIVVTETSLKEATEAPQVVVYVNEEGTPLTTTTETVRLYGIAYAPYTASNDCKSAAQIAADFSELRGNYSVVRTYGTDCEQITKALPAAKNTGLKLILGLFDIGHIEAQVQTIVTAVAGDWSSIDTVSVGNELVNSGKATAEQVITAMTKARTLLRAAGYAGPVVTVDTFVAVLTNPTLCDASDYCALNIHPFFDKNTAAKDAGPFVTRIVSQVQAKLSDRNKRIVCTETGWPWQGDSNGAAVPGVSEQRLAVDSIKEAFASHPGDVILFSAFNDLWKHSDASTFHAEKYWGIGGVLSGSSK
ncbi:Cell surface mannoprotein MP65 [Colletotrichum sp. SAR 10_99]|nr:Cell surface mannoprotein MP65 [Colletotrichum sp. SAR 10_96]KAI8255221.1 Cell surface mannoprotein MP65 [Colletotrichum sp. SAR 10_98]KAJ5006517.1 Cell surface mannoprotein MP65 [Colletotrichum sp. SAR 10_99]